MQNDTSKTNNQPQLFRSSLEAMLNDRHPYIQAGKLNRLATKRKEHKRYEFGCKVSLSVTNKGNWITSIAALHGNLFDGHTLSETVSRSENVTAAKVKEVYVGRGYRGHDYVADAKVYKQDGKLKQLTRAVKRKLKR